MLHTQTVDGQTLALIKTLMDEKMLDDFALVGGTALALKLGHRISIDIDLFSERPFDAIKIARLLGERYQAYDFRILQNGVFCYIDEVKIDLLSHQYPLVKSLDITDKIRMYSLEDIAAMKMGAIVQNGTRKKDFADIYVLLEHKTLSQIIAAYCQKYYPNVNAAMANYGLSYRREIDHHTNITFVDRVLDWKAVEERLDKSMRNPALKFAKQTITQKQGIVRKKRGPRL